MNRKLAKVFVLAAALSGFAALPAFAEEESGLTADEQSAIAEDQAADATAAVSRHIFVCHARNAHGTLYRGVGLSLLRAGARGLTKCRGVSSLELRPTCKLTRCIMFKY